MFNCGASMCPSSLLRISVLFTDTAESLLSVLAFDECQNVAAQSKKIYMYDLFTIHAI